MIDYPPTFLPTYLPPSPPYLGLPPGALPLADLGPGPECIEDGADAAAGVGVAAPHGADAAGAAVAVAVAPADGLAAEATPRRLDEPYPLNRVSVFLLDSDSGGDEKGNKLLVHRQTQRNPNVWILDLDCLLHQY